jgi:hypothetical protein
MRTPKTINAQPAPTDQTTPSLIDVGGLPAVAQALVATVVEALRDAEMRAVAAEQAADRAEKCAADAAELVQEAETAAKAATAAIAEERRRHADDLAAIAAARDAFNARVDQALAAAGADGVIAVAPSVADDPSARDNPAAVTLDALVEEVCATMVAQGEAADRAAALSMLLAEAASLRVRRVAAAPASLPAAAPPS